MSASHWVHIEATILRETANAILIQVESHDEPIWIPRSQIADSDYYDSGDSGTISISEWIARKKGIYA